MDEASGRGNLDGASDRGDLDEASDAGERATNAASGSTSGNGTAVALAPGPGIAETLEAGWASEPGGVLPLILEKWFRDVLACPANASLLRELLAGAPGDLARGSGCVNCGAFADQLALTDLRVVAKEFPLVYDRVGYQLKYVDVLLAAGPDALLVLELKRRVTGLKRVVAQVTEYTGLLEVNLADLGAADFPLPLHSRVQETLLQHAGVAPGAPPRVTIHPGILALKPLGRVKGDARGLPVLGTDPALLARLVRNFVTFHVDRVDALTPGFRPLLEARCLGADPDPPGRFPLPMTAFARGLPRAGPGAGDLAPEYQFRFVDLERRASDPDRVPVPRDAVARHVPGILPDDLPVIYPPLTNAEFTRAIAPGGRFTFQVFRSGWTAPTLFLEGAGGGWFVPLQMDRARLATLKAPVNETIAYDARPAREPGQPADVAGKRTFFSDVLLLDMGTYEAHRVTRAGVPFTTVQLHGRRFETEFDLLGPKLRTDLQGTTPFMARADFLASWGDLLDGFPEKVFSHDWITTLFRLTPLE